MAATGTKLQLILEQGNVNKQDHMLKNTSENWLDRKLKLKNKLLKNYNKQVNR